MSRQRGLFCSDKMKRRLIKWGRAYNLESGEMIICHFYVKLCILWRCVIHSPNNRTSLFLFQVYHQDLSHYVLKMHKIKEAGGESEKWLCVFVGGGGRGCGG